MEGRSTNRRGGPLGVVFQAEEIVGSSSRMQKMKERHCSITSDEEPSGKRVARGKPEGTAKVETALSEV